MELGQIPGRGSFAAPVHSLAAPSFASFAAPCYVGNSTPHAAEGILVQQQGVDSVGIGHGLGCADTGSSNDRDAAQTRLLQGKGNLLVGLCRPNK